MMMIIPYYFFRRGFSMQIANLLKNKIGSSYHRYSINLSQHSSMCKFQHKKVKRVSRLSCQKLWIQGLFNPRKTCKRGSFQQKRRSSAKAAAAESEVFQLVVITRCRCFFTRCALQNFAASCYERSQRKQYCFTFFLSATGECQKVISIQLSYFVGPVHIKDMWTEIGALFSPPLSHNLKHGMHHRSRENEGI